MLTQHKPHTFTFPCTLYWYLEYPAQTTIKAELTACNNKHNSYLFVPRHGGSGEPALPPTEALDRLQKEKRNNHSSDPALPPTDTLDWWQKDKRTNF